MATSMQVRAISCPLPRTGGSINLAIGVPGDSRLASHIDELVAKLVKPLQGKVVPVVDAYVADGQTGACDKYVTVPLRESTEEDGAPQMIIAISTTLSVVVNTVMVNILTRINIFDDLLQIAKQLLGITPHEKMILRGLCLVGGQA